MIEHELEMVPTSSEDKFESWLRKLVARFGLRITLDSSLKTYPGSRHWHLKKGNERGTLEVTYLPGEKRAWLSIHENRNAPWIADIVGSVQDGTDESV